MASIKYNPVLVGVEHVDENIEATKKVIDLQGIAIKSVAIEGIWPETIKLIESIPRKTMPYAESALRKAIVYSPKRRSSNFSAELALYAAKKGLKLVSIDSLYASFKAAKQIDQHKEIEKKISDIESNIKSAKGVPASTLKEVFKILRQKARLVKKNDIFNLVLREKFMVKRIGRFRPGMIIVGLTHTGPIRKAFHIKQKPIIVVSPKGLPLVQKEIRTLFARRALRRMQLAIYRKTKAAKKRRKNR